jgi:hypothetical protein
MLRFWSEHFNLVIKWVNESKIEIWIWKMTVRIKWTNLVASKIIKKILIIIMIKKGEQRGLSHIRLFLHIFKIWKFELEVWVEFEIGKKNQKIEKKTRNVPCEQEGVPPCETEVPRCRALGIWPWSFVGSRGWLWCSHWGAKVTWGGWIWAELGILPLCR